MMGFALTVATLLLVGALAAGVFRILRGPSLADRVVALDYLSIVLLALIGVFVIRFDQPVYLDVAIIIGLLTFLGTVAFARYLERRPSA